MGNHRAFSEYKKFVAYIERQVKNQHAIEIKADENYQKNELYGGRWFKELATNEVWRLIEPDFPFKGRWEKINSQF